MSTDAREMVSAIRGKLAERLGNDRYEVWFGPTTQLVVRGETLIVIVSNQFFQDWLRSHFRKELEAVACEVCGACVSLEFRVAEATQSPAPATKPAVLAPQPSANEAAHNILKVADESQAAPPATLRRMESLDSFVVGNSNCLAHKAAQIAAEKPGSYSPLLVYGPTGTGKTHLLEGILVAFRQSRPRAAAVYLSAEQFTSYFLEALHGSGLPSFRRKHRGLELLIIDDLQFFANKRATLVELLHTIDTLLRAGRQLVFAADRSPTNLKALGSELLARLSGGMPCRLDPADYPIRLGIVRQLAARLGVEVPEDVAEYIAKQFTAQLRELSGAIKRLHATSLAHRQPITLAMAEEALCELIDQSGRSVKLADIEKAVCDVLGLTPDSLQGGGKGKTFCQPRMLAMWLARKHTRAGLSEIGSYFGRRSHATVISAHKKIESLMAAGKPVQLAHRTLSLEETIRRVEEQLRAG